MIASIVSCNLTSIKWIQSIRSSHLNYIMTTHYSIVDSFLYDSIYQCLIYNRYKDDGYELLCISVFNL